MHLEITPELAELRAALRRFTTEVLEPLALEIDQTGEVPTRAWDVMRAQGYLGMRMPAQFGGGDVDLSTYCLALEEFSRSHRVFTLMLDATSGLNPIAIAKFGTPAQQEQYLHGLCTGRLLASFALTEPGAGSDAQAISTKAEMTLTGWRLNGRKHYISGAHQADVLLVMAVNDSEKRSRGGISAFLVDQGTPGLTVTRVDTTIGSDPIKICELTFEDCEIPNSAVLGEVGQGFKIAMSSLVSGRMGIACSCIGAADRLLEMSAAYARERHTFGKPLAERQAIQWMLADSATELAQARALTYETLRQIEAGQDVGSAASMCKLAASEMVGRVADRAVQIHGGAGLVRGVPVERFYRDIRHYRVGEGSSEIRAHADRARGAGMTRVNGAGRKPLNAAIVGIGESTVGRVPQLDALGLQRMAAANALADAGLKFADVDGLLTTPIRVENWAMPCGVVSEGLGIQARYLATLDVAGASGVAMAHHAAMAVASGQCETVLCVAGQNMLSFQSRGDAVQKLADAGWAHPDFEMPHGPLVPTLYALAAQRHMHEYGTTHEQLAQVAVTMRENASLNPYAHKKDLISIADVMQSRMITSPLRMLDCALVSDGAVAFIVTTPERARDLRQKPIKLLGHGYGHSHTYIGDYKNVTTTGAVRSGQEAYAMAGLTPRDIDVAQLYDCFTITVLIELEDLGFCAKGEGGHYVASQGIGLKSPLPVTTHGGLLSAGHPGLAGGMFHLTEGVRQLRGQAQARQVPDAQVVLVHGNGGIIGLHNTLILGKG